MKGIIIIIINLRLISLSRPKNLEKNTSPKLFGSDMSVDQSFLGLATTSSSKYLGEVFEFKFKFSCNFEFNSLEFSYKVRSKLLNIFLDKFNAP